MRREEWEKWFRVEREEIGDDTLGGSVLKCQLWSRNEVGGRGERTRLTTHTLEPRL